MQLLAVGFAQVKYFDFLSLILVNLDNPIEIKFITIGSAEPHSKYKGKFGIF